MNETLIGQDQHEQYQESVRLIKKKRKVIQHFFSLIIGSVFLFVINKILLIGNSYNWWLWASLIWSFSFSIQFINVFIINVFWGKEWERKQQEKVLKKLLDKQQQAEESKKTAENFEKHYKAMEDPVFEHQSANTEN